ncbi:hypothetical protein L6164_007502 [Bauhinia variegata]|uniref:Uncharacterized protein n=1 Tax=Bauhinia variegata TaxID=167791 RepID=A0ACB9PDL6_BAUVA|nr:hypothetical protein L6164_007502 [Bauhinia variegata]
MKFGKEFKTHLEETIPEWRDKFLCYKPLKKLLKQQVPATPGAAVHGDPLQRQIDSEPDFPVVVDGPQDRPEPAGRPPSELEEWFIGILNEELEKLNDFYMDKEEDFVIRFEELKQRIEQLKEKSSKDNMYTSESEFSEEMMDILKDLVTIHGQMVLLKNYSSLNFAGLIKILKKYDKRTGGLLRLPFTQLVLRQPFFTTESLTRLVRECEANLELLFPVKAEVIESTPPTEDQSEPHEDNATNMLPEASPNVGDLGEETLYIYRSTLAAMKAIRSLQKASSTNNPFSFSTLFRDQDADSTGAVTAENSATNSPATLQNEEDTDVEETHSM